MISPAEQQLSLGPPRGVLERLRSAGARVWGWDMSPVRDEGISSIRVDVRDGQQIAAALQQVLSQNGRVDILVNSAGYLGGYRSFEEHDRSDWQQIVSTNLFGVLEVCSQVLPHMRRVGEGRIVNMGSLAGKDGLANMPLYSAASAGQPGRPARSEVGDALRPRLRVLRPLTATVLRAPRHLIVSMGYGGTRERVVQRLR